MGYGRTTCSSRQKDRRASERVITNAGPRAMGHGRTTCSSRQKDRRASERAITNAGPRAMGELHVALDRKTEEQVKER